MKLHELRPAFGSKKKRKIVGRGRGSGHGKTSGRGMNGTGSRSGRGVLASLEGGQMPLIRRLPKVGFNSKAPIFHQVVNVENLDKFAKGTIVTGQLLKSRGLIRSAEKTFKILGKGELTKALTVQAKHISKSAQEKIVKAGGKVEPLEIKLDVLKESKKS